MKGQSIKIKEKNIKRLKEIFPEVFTEDKIDFEKLQLGLGENIEDGEERYSFNWHGKRDAIRISQTPTTGTLRPDKERIEDLDIGFKSFKLDSSNIKEWNPEYKDKEFTLEDLVDNLLPDRSEEDLLYEIMIKYGISLSTPIEEHKVGDKTIYNIGFGSLFVCLDNDIDKCVVEKILNLNKEYKMPNPVVVFKDTGFKDDSIKLNAKLSLNDIGIDEVVSI